MFDSFHHSLLILPLYFTPFPLLRSSQCRSILTPQAGSLHLACAWARSVSTPKPKCLPSMEGIQARVCEDQLQGSVSERGFCEFRALWGCSPCLAGQAQLQAKRVWDAGSRSPGTPASLLRPHETQGQFTEVTEVSRVSPLCGHVSRVHHHLPKVRAQPDSWWCAPVMLGLLNSPVGCELLRHLYANLDAGPAAPQENLLATGDEGGGKQGSVFTGDTGRQGC